MPFARTDVVPIDDERWEVRVEGSTDDELDEKRVLVDVEAVELPDPA